MNNTQKAKKEAKEFMESEVKHLRELMEVNDLRPSDLESAVQNINYLKSKAGLETITQVQLAGYLC